MINNSVTHLRSYTNSAPISPVTPHGRWRLRIERRYRRIEWHPRDRRRRCPKADVSTNTQSWVFHDVSQCFKSVSWCFTNGSWCFTKYLNVLHVFHIVLLCFLMFSESLNDRRPPQGSRQRRRDRRYCRECDPMLNSVLNGDWSNSVPGRKILEGVYQKSISYINFVDNE